MKSKFYERSPLENKSPHALFCKRGVRGDLWIGFATALLFSCVSFTAGYAQEEKKKGFLSEMFEVEESTEPVKKWPSDFVKELAKRLQRPVDELEKLERQGFGRTEIISFVAIAEKSDKKWDDLVKERKKGKPLRKMAEEADVDYNELFLKSRIMKNDVDNYLKSTAVKTEEEQISEIKLEGEK